MTHIENNWEKKFDDKFGENIRNCRCDCHNKPIPPLPRTLCIHCNYFMTRNKIKDFIRSLLSATEQRIRKEVVEEIDKKLDALYTDLGWGVDKGDPNYDSYEWGVMRTLAELKCFIFSLTPPKEEDNN